MRLQNHTPPHVNEPGCNGIDQRQVNHFAQTQPRRFHAPTALRSPFDATHELSFWRLFQVLQPSQR